MRCPKCRGSDVHSTKMAAPGASHARGALRAGGHPLLAAGVLALQALGALNNTIRHKLSCSSCSHEFSPTAGGCARCTDKTAKMYHLYCCRTLICQTCNDELGRLSSSTCEMCNKPLVRR